MSLPPGSVSPADAAAPQSGKQAPGFFRFRVGDFEITMLNDGGGARKVDEAFIPNAPVEEVRKLLAAQHMPTDAIPTSFTAVAVNTGSKLILIDTGFANNGGAGTGMLAANMAAAGIDPQHIDVALITHFHGDHISGLRTKEGALVYPNAEIMVPAPEWAYWMDDARMNAAPEAGRAGFINARRVFSPIAKDVRRFEGAREVTPGISALPTHGHTPGHTAYVIASGAAKLLALGDACNDPRIFARRPDFHFAADVDKPMAVQSRRAVLEMAAAERIPLATYHAAFPAVGRVVKNGDGFDWAPLPYSPFL